MGVRWSRNQPKIAKIGIRGKNHKIIYFSIFYYVEGGGHVDEAPETLLYTSENTNYTNYTNAIV